MTISNVQCASQKPQNSFGVKKSMKWTKDNTVDFKTQEKWSDERRKKRRLIDGDQVFVGNESEDEDEENFYDNDLIPEHHHW